jgi:hypothetical protein
MKREDRIETLERRLIDAYQSTGSDDAGLSAAARSSVLRSVRLEHSAGDDHRASLALRWSFAAAVASMALAAYVMPREVLDDAAALQSSQDDETAISDMMTAPFASSLEEL